MYMVDYSSKFGRYTRGSIHGSPLLPSRKLQSSEVCSLQPRCFGRLLPSTGGPAMARDDEPPIVLVPGFLGKDTHWHLAQVRHRHPHQRWLTTTPGPMSSHHDRACEVFYAIKGGQVDYGEEHARRCGHARFGRVHRVGLFPEWDENHPIDAVGHSIGGVTLRVLQHLLAEGGFPKHSTSAAWVRSITALASPLNGDPVVYGLGMHMEPAALGEQHAKQWPAAERVPSPPSPGSDRVQAHPYRRPKLSPSPSHCSLCAEPYTSSSSSSSSPPPSPSASHRVRFLSAGWLLTQAIHILAWLDWTPLNRVVDLRLDHWHLSRHRHPFISSLSTLMRGTSISSAASDPPLSSHTVSLIP